MNPRAIKRISIKNLFGAYDYELNVSDAATDADRLMIFYGDNGSGKTTILKALFYLLSPDAGKGHKTELAGLPLSFLQVEFTTGGHILFQREGKEIIGSYTISLSLPEQKLITCKFDVSKDGRIEKSEKTTSFLRKMSVMNLTLYFLSDDRAIRLAGVDQRDASSMEDEELAGNVLVGENMHTEWVRRQVSSDPSQRAQQLLVKSIKRAEQWIQSQAVRGSSEGESSVNALYTDILSRISGVPINDKSVQSGGLEDLERRISTLEIRSRTYATYGLLPAFHGQEILGIAKAASPAHLNLVASVLAPYLESVQKKLDAMEGLQKQINSLVVLINSFYTRKRLSYDIHEGFRIVSDDGKQLQPQMLSSGERHLLLLFCNTIQALDRPSIFMIDEPEISLNMKWQRKLLPALQECAGDNPVQYLFATHSFEILARYKNNAVTLLSSR